jgi:hypothetical protein
MKLSNIFKKTTATGVKPNIEKLEKNQLEKVIGGTDTTDTTVTTSDITKTTSDMSTKIIGNIRA